MLFKHLDLQGNRKKACNKWSPKQDTERERERHREQKNKKCSTLFNIFLIFFIFDILMNI